MLSDEEKQAIEIVKGITKDNLLNYWGGPEEPYNAIQTVLNLIEKQSKEIEHQKEKRENQKKELAILNAKQIEFNKLVNTVNSYKGQFKRQEKEIEELKEEQAKRQWIHIKENGEVEPLFYVSKDKIKAKIEEYDDKGMTVNLVNRSVGKTFQQAVHYEVKKVLQSLLEKE